MAYLSVDEQKEAITQVGVTGLGMSHADVQAMIDKRGDDRLELNKLRVKLNDTYKSKCGEMDRDADNVDAEARAAAAWLQHDANQEQAARDRKQQRERLTPGARIDRVLMQLNAMSAVKSGWKEAEPELKNVTVPKAFGWKDPGTVADLGLVDVSPILAGLTYLVEQLELVLDAERRLAAPQDLAKLTGEAKDRIILNNLRGVHSDDVAQFAPWLGSSRSIRRLRSENGQRIDGTDRAAA